MPQLQVWQRRQEMPSQQVITGPAPIEGVERTKAVVVYPQQRAGFAQRNPYTMDVDRERNCYACGGFGHLARHCRNRRMGMNQRMEVGQDNNSNLNGERGLGSPN